MKQKIIIHENYGDSFIGNFLLKTIPKKCKLKIITDNILINLVNNFNLNNLSQEDYSIRFKTRILQILRNCNLDYKIAKSISANFLDYLDYLPIFDLSVILVDKNRSFQIKIYDGAESIQYLDEMEFIFEIL